MISATLEPPKILINTKDPSTVTWRTTFKEGTLVYKTENGDETYYPIDGWAVDTIVPLGKSHADLSGIILSLILSSLSVASLVTRHK